MKILSPELSQELVERARVSPRLRSHHCLHSESSDPIQRFIVAMCLGSYARPHRHNRADAWELLSLVTGRLAILIFNDEGLIERAIDVSKASPIIEIPAGRWHCLIALADSLFMEVKAGPYIPELAVEFAAFAPEEGSPLQQEYQQGLLEQLRTGVLGLVL